MSKKEIKSRETKVYFNKEFDRFETSSYKYQIFDENGFLIDDYKCSFMKSLSLNIFNLGNNINIKFDDSTFAKKGIVKGEEQFVNISQSNKTHMNITSDNSEWNKIINTTNNFYDGLNSYLTLNKNIGGIFIDNNNKCKLKLIQEFLRNITKFGNNYELTVYDPYFGITFVENKNNKNIKEEKLITSNSFDIFFTLSQNVKLIIYSCNDIDLETKKNKQKIQEIFDKLKSYRIPIGNTEWYNNKKNYFHDRYIKIKNKDTNQIQLFMVSNSFNSILKKYPLCITELLGKTKEDTLQYLKLLESEKGENLLKKELN